jgi:hypothetical protein
MKSSKIERLARLVEALARYGFAADEVAALLKIERTLQRWAELECGDGNDYGSWAIERDDATGKPFLVHHHYLHGRGKDYSTRRAVADREAGALKRLAAIMAGKSGVVAYHQSDPRGCQVWIVPKDRITGSGVECCYTNGVAVCID